MPIKLRTGDKIVFSFLAGIAAIGMTVTAIFPKPEAVVDETRSIYLQTEFAEAIAQGIESPYNTHYFIPDFLSEAGATLNDYETQQTEIELARADGDRSAALRALELANDNTHDAAEATYMRDEGRARIIGIYCKNASTEDTYNCSLYRAEFGGVEGGPDGLAACGRLVDKFNAFKNADGDITVTSYGDQYARSLTLTTEDFTGAAEGYTRNYLGRVDSGKGPYELNDSQKNAGQAILRFGKCLTNS